MMTEADWDYVIVGAGSSGCVMAERLSRTGRNRVLVIEAGGANRSPLFAMPKGVGKLVHDPRYASHYPVHQARVPGEPATESWVRGRGLGGSSAINGMIWSRGQPSDYDRWAFAGATGWNWQAMRRAFMAIEDHDLGPGDGRGVGGPVHVSSGKFRYAIAEAAIDAGVSMGLTRRDDLNSEDIEGIGYYAHNIRRGRRQSAYKAFLQPALRRPNVSVLLNAQVQRIVFDQGGRACALEVSCRDGLRTVKLGGEVILSAGAIESPAILQRSGIGPGDVLKAAGVDPLRDRPAIGRNLREHLGMSLAFRLGVPGNNREFRNWRLVRNLVRYGLFGSGPLATGPYEVGAFVRSMPDAVDPDLQIYASAFTFARGGNPNFPVQLSVVEQEPGLTIYGQMLQLTSLGTIGITGTGLDVPLDIRPNWLSTDHDQQCAIAAMRTMRRLASQPSLRNLLIAELSPGASCSSDADLLEAVRRLSRCGTHAVGSCAMGDDAAALDADCRVRGVQGVRVVDCSAMPGLVSGNTNAPAMAFAWETANRMLSHR